MPEHWLGRGNDRLANFGPEGVGDRGFGQPFPGAVHASFIDQTVQSDVRSTHGLSGDATTVVIGDGETTLW
jgi:hypothetical protein